MPKVSFTINSGKHAILLSYTEEEIGELADQRFFLEAFGRLDKMIDQVLFGLMHKYFAQANDLVSVLVDDELSGLAAAKTLHATGKISKKLFESILSFKTSRNVVAHDIYGHYAFALRQVGEVKDEADLVRKADSRARMKIQEGLRFFSQLMDLLRTPLLDVKK